MYAPEVPAPEHWYNVPSWLIWFYGRVFRNYDGQPEIPVSGLVLGRFDFEEAIDEDQRCQTWWLVTLTDEFGEIEVQVPFEVYEKATKDDPVRLTYKVGRYTGRAGQWRFDCLLDLDASG